MSGMGLDSCRCPSGTRFCILSVRFHLRCSLVSLVSFRVWLSCLASVSACLDKVFQVWMASSLGLAWSMTSFRMVSIVSCSALITEA